MNSNHRDDIYFSLKKIFESLFESLIRSVEGTADPTTIRILDYINQNYDQDLSLTDISLKFNLTEGYISRLLKKNANINFKKHLNQLKINKAKELLQNGNHKVNEVSALVGYKNVNTFIRIFKQQEGIPPGEYSKLR
ncbi:helix-turn-helix transcriptional regulator [Bacillaceae bacterium SIJ1]|uniref:helix-turn-helix transcriptional regulator n=1 Tax=Litoribacterium kuwaitense TaxID=1398745 RepID=UPI0013EAC366|nr:AraC family transcriptional regulator [Litoribacterium kuwaitense]NGP45148.1 helix-turn-helix transcriptional regulator [Litoribacterium kuwaitense]